MANETVNHEEHGRIYESKTDASSVFEQYQSLGHLVIDKLQNEHPDKIIFIDATSGREWTGAKLARAILNTAAALRDKHALERGQAICISFEHGDRTCILAFGAVCAGALVSASYHRDPYAEVLHLARLVEPRLFFCHAHKLDWAKQLRADIGYEVEAVAMDNEADLFASYFDYDHQASASRRHIPLACSSLEDEFCFVTMTSGTTGKPKAIPVSHKICLARSGTISDETLQRPFEKLWICPTPIDYVSGRLNLLSSFRNGCTAILTSDFEPLTLLNAIQRYRVSILTVGAASFYSLITHAQLDQFDLSSVRVIFPMGAKVVFVDQLRRLLERSPHIVQANQAYGSSEAMISSLMESAPEVYLRDPNDSGPLQPGVRLKIVDTKTGKLLGGPNETGAILVQSPWLFPGYYDIALKRARLQRGDCESIAGGPPAIESARDCLRIEGVFDADGFYDSGDLGYMDEREHLHIVGRSKELMNCRATRKVIPHELEEHLAEHPAVSKCCVLGVAHALKPALDCPRAFIVVQSSCYDGAPTSGGPSSAHSGAKLASDHDAAAAALSPCLEYTGESKLCSLSASVRRALARDIMDFMNGRVSWTKQLTGGIVLLDTIPVMKPSGKMDKSYLRALTQSEVEIYGDFSNTDDSKVDPK